MKTHEQEGLLADVLRAANDEAYREEALGLMLRLARRRRLARRGRLIVAVAIAVTMGGALAWQARAKRGSERATEMCAVVHTQTLPTTAIVRTRALAAGSLVMTTDRVAVVSTKLNRGSFQLVNDQELIALAGPRPAVLVRMAKGAELIFVDRNDHAGERPN